VTAAVRTGYATTRVSIGRVPIDPVDLAGSVEVIERLIEAGRGGTVFTPNVDHVVLADENERFRCAYENVSLSLVDGMPVLWASRLLGTPLPAKVSGSDLIEPLMERAAARGHRVYFLGGAPGVAESARDKLRARLPELQVVGTDSSYIDVDAKHDDVIGRIQAAKPELVLVALGAPKQEVWSHEQREALAPAVLIGVGAGLDFIAGTQKRAPRWVSEAGFEWLYRLASDPRRLAARYVLRDPWFCWILMRQMAGLTR
jgi:N-acetylglucosaminyldiphosphoundecaprenol N-acetyl-beta-D-mannosaminyltransferase